MHRHRPSRPLSAVAAVLLFLLTPLAARAQDLADGLGACHIDPLYYFGSKDSLNQGADETVATGSKVIKVQMSRVTPDKYSWNSAWPDVTNYTLTQLAQVSYFTNLFKNPGLTTYVITTYCPKITGNPPGLPEAYWYFGPNQSAQFADEQQQFQNLANYLLTTTAFSNKVFILENWEGDNALAGAAGNDPSNPPPGGHYNNVPSSAIQGMIAWFNARGAGVRAARAAHPNPANGNQVYLSCEVNSVTWAIDQYNHNANFNDSVVPTYPYTVTGNVIPWVAIDKVGYSCYDTMGTTTGTYSFASAVDFIKLKWGAPDYADIGVGEFGYNVFNKTPAQITKGVNNVIDTAVAKGMSHVLYWALYNNVPGAAHWMMTDTGAPDTAWHHWRFRAISTSSTRGTATKVKSTCTLKYTSNFTASGLGTGWTTTNASGAVQWTPLANNLLNMKVLNGTNDPYGLATLTTTGSSVAGRALVPGDYIQFTVKRLSGRGNIGTSHYSHNIGSVWATGAQPIQIFWSGAWIPFSWDAADDSPTVNWDSGLTLGMRIDTMDGTFASFSYYFNDAYLGSWIFPTTATSLPTINLYAQDDLNGSQFQFGKVQIYLHK